ncbi:MAG: hypothetical protein Q9190_007357, partial [Brigantiaea leucoxantha]
MDDDDDDPGTYVTSLSFSSTEGGHSILAIGKNNGQITLWSLFDEGARFESQQPDAVACLAFKPVPTRRASERFGIMVLTEELLVGDDHGTVYYYATEWLNNFQVDLHGWNGSMSLLAKISIHTQQICGLFWSPDGEYFASGANDNLCCLFEVKEILAPRETSETRGARGRKSTEPSSTSPGEQNRVLNIDEGRLKQKWAHSAAIKAIAFCPWQRGLIATGGGSNDRAIHFYHTFSGACLATIDVQAQVTSLIWSTSRREIAATFGYAQPDHP